MNPFGHSILCKITFLFDLKELLGIILSFKIFGAENQLISAS